MGIAFFANLLFIFYSVIFMYATSIYIGCGLCMYMQILFGIKLEVLYIHNSGKEHDTAIVSLPVPPQHSTVTNVRYEHRTACSRV